MAAAGSIASERWVWCLATFEMPRQQGVRLSIEARTETKLHILRGNAVADQHRLYSSLQACRGIQMIPAWTRWQMKNSVDRTHMTSLGMYSQVHHGQQKI